MRQGMSVTPAQWEVKQEDHDLESSLGDPKSFPKN